MRKVQERPTFRTPSSGPHMRDLEALHSQLTDLFGEYGFRSNYAAPKDGTERMEAPLPLGTYTTIPDTRPVAADWEGSLIYVTDLQEFQGSDGTVWAGAGSIPPAGETNTSSNIGSGADVAAAKVGVDLPFRRLNGGTGVTVTQVGDSIEIRGTTPTGDVSGPASATDNALARYNGTTGKIIQDSVSSFSDVGSLALGDGTQPGLFLVVQSSDGVFGLQVTSTEAVLQHPGTTVNFPLRIFFSTTGDSVYLYHAGAASPEGVVTALQGSLAVGDGVDGRNALFVKTVGSGNTGWTELSQLGQMNMAGVDASAAYPIVAIGGGGEGQPWKTGVASCRKTTSPGGTLSIGIGAIFNSELQFDITGVHVGIVKKDGDAAVSVVGWARVDDWVVEADPASLWEAANHAWLIPGSPPFNQIKLTVQAAFDNTSSPASATAAAVLGLGTHVLNPDALPGDMTVHGFTEIGANNRFSQSLMAPFSSFWIPVVGGERFSIWGDMLENTADLIAENVNNKSITWFSIETRKVV